MKDKGVSAIIATVLLLMITIALVGTAYIYFSGMLGGKTRKTISVQDAYCNASSITVVLSNDGTTDIVTGDITFFVNNAQDTSVTWIPILPLAPHKIAVVNDVNEGVSSGNTYTVLVVSPTNSVRHVVSC